MDCPSRQEADEKVGRRNGRLPKEKQKNRAAANRKQGSALRAKEHAPKKKPRHFSISRDTAKRSRDLAERRLSKEKMLMGEAKQWKMELPASEARRWPKRGHYDHVR